MSVKNFCFANVKFLTNNLKILFNAKMPYYAVARGRTSGIFMNWADCESQVKGFPGARYKKFNTAVDAEQFILSEKGSKVSKNKTESSNKQKNINNTTADTKPISQVLKSKPESSNKRKINNITAGTKTISEDNGNNKVIDKSAKKRTSTISQDNHISSDEDFDDVNSILNKQMDDIEERLKGFEKGVDTIIKKNLKASEKKTILIDPPQPKKRKKGKLEFAEDPDGFVQVYTDGACSSNGKNGARAGIGVYWGSDHPLNVSDPVIGRATNNCGEIQAATCAIKQALQNDIRKLTINTDSKFLINSVTKWMPGWKRKGWKLKSGEPVKNERDFKDLDNFQNQLQIKWNYVEAHRGVHGNEMADQLAKAGAARYTN